MTLSRREFLKLVGGAAGFAALRPFEKVSPLPEFPKSVNLGRIIEGKFSCFASPTNQSAVIRNYYTDDIVSWNREVVGKRDTNLINQRWVETDEGFVYASYVQPVKNEPNQALERIPDGTNGFWAEVSVPYVDFVLENENPASPWLKDTIALQLPTRLYYSQVMWVDQVKRSDVTGNIIYRINEKYGSYGDLMWAEASAFRTIIADEIEPIHPEIDPDSKKVVVNATYQTLSCFEEDREVYFCKVSTGAKFDAYGNLVDKWATPIGLGHRTWRKSISIHMAGGTASGSGYDTPGVSWATFFSGDGVAIHSTFWHNDYGVPRSHGCVNTKPDDAKWIYRWTTPISDLASDDVTVGMPGGTKIDVIESL